MRWKRSRIGTMTPENTARIRRTAGWSTLPFRRTPTGISITLAPGRGRSPPPPCSRPCATSGRCGSTTWAGRSIGGSATPIRGSRSSRGSTRRWDGRGWGSSSAAIRRSRVGRTGETRSPTTSTSWPTRPGTSF